MIKLAISFALAVATAAPVTQYVSLPPSEFQGGAPIAVRLITGPRADIDPACKFLGGQVGPGMVIAACYKNGVIVAPDPCDPFFAGEKFADLMCHEIGHARGWSHEVE